MVFQGVTIDYARMKLGQCARHYNQVYTALSRVRTLDGLYLDEFDPSACRAHPDALKYHQELANPLANPPSPVKTKHPRTAPHVGLLFFKKYKRRV